MRSAHALDRGGELDYVNATNIGLAIVSIFVAILTFVISERRSRRNKWQTSKDSILKDNEYP